MRSPLPWNTGPGSNLTVAEDGPSALCDPLAALTGPYARGRNAVCRAGALSGFRAGGPACETPPGMPPASRVAGPGGGGARTIRLCDLAGDLLGLASKSTCGHRSRRTGAHRGGHGRSSSQQTLAPTRRASSSARSWRRRYDASRRRASAAAASRRCAARSVASCSASRSRSSCAVRSRSQRSVRAGDPSGSAPRAKATSRPTPAAR